MEQETNTPQAPQAPQTEGNATKTTLRLRELMSQKQISPIQLCTLADMHTANLSLLVNGKRNPTLDTLDRLAQALGVPTWYLIQDPDSVDSDVIRAKDEEHAAAIADMQAEIDRLKALVEELQAQPAQSPQKATETPTDALQPDLIAVDPRTGETHLYRLIS